MRRAQRIPGARRPTLAIGRLAGGVGCALAVLLAGGAARADDRAPFSVAIPAKASSPANPASPEGSVGEAKPRSQKDAGKKDAGKKDAGKKDAGKKDAGKKDAGSDTSDLEALLGEAVVTTASRGSETARLAPATVLNISGADILRFGLRTLDEALEYLGLGLFLSKPRDYLTGIDVGGQGVLLRGAGRHVLVMLDGTVLNSQGTGRISLHEAVGVPLELIDHVEVMLGPGSVMYGSNAMLAVINIVSKGAAALGRVYMSAELGGSLAQDERGSLTTGPGSHPGLRYRLGLGAASRFTLFGKEGEVTVGAEWTHEVSSTYGVTPFSTFENADASLLPGQTSWGGSASHTLRAPSGLVTVKLGDFRLLVSAFDYYRGMPLVGTFREPSSRERQSGVRLDLRHVWDPTRRLNVTSRVYGGWASSSETSTWGEPSWCLPAQAGGCRLESSNSSGWVGLEQQLTVDWFVDGKLVTMVGYDVRARMFDSAPATYTDLATGAPPEPRYYPRSSETSFLGALFAQQTWRPLSWLGLNGGLRVDLDQEFGAALSPRLALVLTPARGTTVRLSYNQAFRAPSQFERTQFDPTYIITPQALRPEHANSFELELQQRLGWLDLQLRGYWSEYYDFIETRGATAAEIERFRDRLSPGASPSEIVVNDNLTELTVYGASASARLRLPAGFHLAGSFNVSAAYTADGARYDRLPLWFGNFRASWQSREDGYSVTAAAVFSGDRQVLATTEVTPYRLGGRFELRLAAGGPVGGVRGLRWRATLGYDASTSVPFLLAAATDTPAGHVLFPNTGGRLLGFLGLHYSYGQ